MASLRDGSATALASASAYLTIVVRGTIARAAVVGRQGDHQRLGLVVQTAKDGVTQGDTVVS